MPQFKKGKKTISTRLLCPTADYTKVICKAGEFAVEKVTFSPAEKLYLLQNFPDFHKSLEWTLVESCPTCKAYTANLIVTDELNEAQEIINSQKEEKND